MKNRFRKALVWLTCAVMMMTLWTGTATAEGEKNTDFLGKPFPDFSVTDTEGKTFTLSEALKDHQAAMIVFWATWCGPCEREFPYLEEVYQKYGDRVAFIALNEEKRETEDEIKAYRAEHGLTIPMGHSEDDDLYRYIGGVYLPDTVVVDRFGNAVFFHDSAFKNPEDVARVLETFLGDDYTQTAVLKSIPGDTSTRAFPVSAARAIYPESGNYQKVVLDWKDQNGERHEEGDDQHGCAAFPGFLSVGPAGPDLMFSVRNSDQCGSCIPCSPHENARRGEFLLVEDPPGDGHGYSNDEKDHNHAALDFTRSFLDKQPCIPGFLFTEGQHRIDDHNGTESSQGGGCPALCGQDHECSE